MRQTNQRCVNGKVKEYIEGKVSRYIRKHTYYYEIHIFHTIDELEVERPPYAQTKNLAKKPTKVDNEMQRFVF
jgi:hypothetical protein